VYASAGASGPLVGLWLVEQLKLRLEREQSLLFLNRRGYVR
jgi:primosomal protein N'